MFADIFIHATNALSTTPAPAATTQSASSTSPLTILLMVAVFTLLVAAGVLRTALGTAAKLAEVVSALGKTAALAAGKAVAVFGVIIVVVFVYQLLLARGSA